MRVEKAGAESASLLILCAGALLDSGGIIDPELLDELPIFARLSQSDQRFARNMSFPLVQTGLFGCAQISRVSSGRSKTPA